MSEIQAKKNRKRKRFTNKVLPLLLFLMLLVGAGLLLYPSVSDYVNSINQTKALVGYAENVSNITEEEYAQMWEAADAFNRRIRERDNVYVLSEQDEAEYGTLLAVGIERLIGYVEVPAADIQLPVLHGTGESALQRGAGHLEWTSLPTGGPSTHTVLSSHRGLPSSLLFTHLDRVVEGDIIILHILDRILTYEVDQIRVTLPIDTESLLIEDGEDYCTLLTCTPYGVNSHRLLIRGHRVENIEQERIARVASDAVEVDPLLIAPLLFAGFITIMLAVILLAPHRSKTVEEEQHETNTL